MKILFLVPYPPGEAPSQRFRFEQYLDFLRLKGNEITLQSFTQAKKWRILSGQGLWVAKIGIVARGMAARCVMLWQVNRYDLVFIHREGAPLGPPLIEWIISRVLRKKVLFDFDDAIWMPERDSESALTRIMKWRSKVGQICRWSYAVSAGNFYLQKYALAFQRNTHLIPTTVDTEFVHNPSLYPKRTEDGKIRILWTGTFSTIKYLKDLEPTLQSIEKKFPQVLFLIIAEQKPTMVLSSVEFIPWNVTTEISDLLRADIGLMPLTDDEWSKGKCGLKALQYMSLGIPCIASPVGVNKEIIDHRVHGFLANTPEEWLEFLKNLFKMNLSGRRLGPRDERGSSPTIL